jgi:hypothetical protein
VGSDWIRDRELPFGGFGTKPTVRGYRLTSRLLAYVLAFSPAQISQDPATNPKPGSLPSLAELSLLKYKILHKKSIPSPLNPSHQFGKRLKYVYYKWRKETIQGTIFLILIEKRFANYRSLLWAQDPLVF